MARSKHGVLEVEDTAGGRARKIWRAQKIRPAGALERFGALKRYGPLHAKIRRARKTLLSLIDGDDCHVNAMSIEDVDDDGLPLPYASLLSV